VQQSVSGLFEAYGYPVSALAPPTSSADKEFNDMGGVIVSAAEQVSGTVVVSTTEDVVVSTPLPGPNASHSSDWVLPGQAWFGPILDCCLQSSARRRGLRQLGCAVRVLPMGP
jgi:hypothetical protein